MPLNYSKFDAIQTSASESVNNQNNAATPDTPGTDTAASPSKPPTAPMLPLLSIPSRHNLHGNGRAWGRRKGELRQGDTHHFGSTMIFIGNAATPYGSRFYFGLSEPYTFSQKQLRTSEAFLEAFGECADATFLERHALTLCHHYNKTFMPETTLMMSSPYTVQENVMLRSHQFIVSALPIEVLTGCVSLASEIRRSLHSYRENPKTTDQRVCRCPNTAAGFEKLQCPNEYRIDALVFLETALNLCLYETAIAFSEPDRKVILVHRGFQPTSEVLAAKTEKEAISAIKPSFLLCYWCGKSSACMQKKMLMCGGCKQLDYCSKSCQRDDWKAFHRNECETLRGQTKTKTGLKQTRKDTLHSSDRYNPTMNLQMGGQVWKDDTLRVYLCNINWNTFTTKEDTFVFPHGGFEIIPRELSHMNEDFSKEAMSTNSQLHKLPILHQ